MADTWQKLILFHGFEDALFEKLTKGVTAILSQETQVTMAAISQNHLPLSVEETILGLIENPGQVLRDNPVVAGEKLVVYIHGFPREELFNLVNGFKMLLPDRKAVAFCTSTKNNISMILGAMIEEVLGDHAYMTRPRSAPVLENSQP